MLPSPLHTKHLPPQTITSPKHRTVTSPQPRTSKPARKRYHLSPPDTRRFQSRC
ncbi:predicted protein [Plenodomus lingam JN3]|uniref:Predicted protein n=1 Tax=Leptosphaeria maculans (strain JN3 / isolate v23.1.3 / race Av1-4-5-6-7-8) TaxID=985895 RepID=E4ZUE7_LEPMJ|nr:predicted protein [Plenodomus lingam JN3]CBX95026.1 predicted protein [Plenodomus lingam JN3]